MTDEAPVSFALDGHLGGLARLLRTLGLDASWRHPINDSVLITEAIEQGRTLLTRDNGLVKRRGIGRHLLIKSNDPEVQLREVLGAFNLRPDPEVWFSRCLICNLPVERVSRQAAAPCVPPFVLAKHERFWRCPGCRRVYWPGTHGDRMRERLNTIIGEGEHDAEG